MHEKFQTLRKKLGRDIPSEKKNLLIKLNIQIASINDLIDNEENGNTERLKEERDLLIKKRDSLLREEGKENSNPENPTNNTEGKEEIAQKVEN